MTLFCTYFSPTTPGAATFSVDMSGAIRLGSVEGLAGEAQLGSVGIGSIVFDDLGSTIGYLGDGIVGLKQMFFTETACPAGNQRLYTSYIGDRRYHRGESDSLILGSDRKVDTTLLDVNSFLEFRVFAPVADDPTSDFDRPAETDIERIDALLTDVDFLSTTLFDIGYVNTVGPVDLDENDYTGARPQDVLSDCAQMSGKNFFVMYDEATNQLVLWYDYWYSDGSATIPFDSTLSLTNVFSEQDETTVFAIAPDAVETLDPSRVISAVYLPFDGGTAYRTLPSTANTFAWRDAVAPSVSVKTLAKAEYLADRYLQENSTESSQITCTVRLPRERVTAIREGMRIQCHFTHLPSVASGMTWTRILQRTIRQDQETEEFYWLDLELSALQVSPMCATQIAGISLTDSGGNAYTASPVSYNIPAGVLPSVEIGFFVGFYGAWDQSDIVLGNGWTFIDHLDLTFHHKIACTAYLVTPSGSAADMEVAWTGQPVEWGIAGLSLQTSATAPLQSGTQGGWYTDEAGSGGTVTLPSPPTDGNLLVLCWTAARGSIAADWQVDIESHGWTFLGGSDFPLPESDIYGVAVRCVVPGESATIYTGESGYAHYASLSEWELT